MLFGSLVLIATAWPEGVEYILTVRFLRSAWLLTLAFAIFNAGCAGGMVPGWFFKLIALGIIWAYLQHFIAGVRHLIMDATHRVSKEQGHSTAVVTLALSAGLTVVLGAKLFGLF